MLTLVEIQNSAGNTLSLPLLDSSAGYAVEEIDGLDPVAATLTTSSIAQMDGAQPQNANRGPRNITMKIGLEPDYVTNTVDSLRQNLFAYLLPKANVQMNFYKDGSLFVTTSGQVETCQNSMFSADPEVDVSIICYDPDLYAPTAETLSANTTSDTNVNAINYEGTSDAGIVFTLNINRDLTGFTLYNTRPDNTIQKFDVEGGAFVDGDVVTITSIPGSKSVILSRAGILSSILYYVDPTSTWPSLQNGSNSFRAYSDGDPIPYTVSYVPKYGAF